MATSDPNGSKRSNTEPKLSRTRGLIPFKKGDPRINRNGRPRTFDAVHALAQQIAREKVKSGELAITDLLRSWRDSHEPVLQKAFVEYAFGKVPDKINLGDNEGKPLKPMVIQVITQVPLPEHERVN